MLRREKVQRIARRAVSIACDADGNLTPMAYVECAWGHLSDRSFNAIMKEIRRIGLEIDDQKDTIEGVRWTT